MDATPRRLRLVDYHSPVPRPRRPRPLEPMWLTATIAVGGIALIAYGLFAVTLLASFTYHHVFR